MTLIPLPLEFSALYTDTAFGEIKMHSYLLSMVHLWIESLAVEWEQERGTNPVRGTKGYCKG